MTGCSIIVKHKYEQIIEALSKNTLKKVANISTQIQKLKPKSPKWDGGQYDISIVANISRVNNFCEANNPNMIYHLHSTRCWANAEGTLSRAKTDPFNYWGTNIWLALSDIECAWRWAFCISAFRVVDLLYMRQNAFNLSKALQSVVEMYFVFNMITGSFGATTCKNNFEGKLKEMTVPYDGHSSITCLIS